MIADSAKREHTERSHRVIPNSVVAESWAEEELCALDTRGLRRHLEPLQSPQGAVVRIGGEELINFSSNDYLGLANHPALIRAGVSALQRHGVGSGASRLLVGDSDAHRALEQRLAAFGSSEAALLFNSGYAANVGILSALCGPEDVIISDELNHASLIDGCRLSRARVAVYPHLNALGAERLLKAIQGRRRLVCTESIFSMDGDRAPLLDLVEICQHHGAALVVDEAHGMGVVGPRGQGLCMELGFADSVDIRVGTLGKAFGAFGAFALTSRSVAELLMNRARSLVFSTSLPPALCATMEAAVSLVENHPENRDGLWRNIRRFSVGLASLGLPTRSDSPIFPVVLGKPERAVAAAQQLRARGVLVKPIRPPTVPEGTSRLRFSISAAHADVHLDQALQALQEVLPL